MEMPKIIDLSVSVSLKGNLKVKPQIVYRRHEDTPKVYAEMYGLKPEDFPDGKYCAAEVVTLGTHNTTHLDAPYHFGANSEGKPAKTIDQIPLEWCYGDGVVLDFHHKKKGEGISAEDVKKELQRMGYKIKPFDIVLIRTDMYKHYDQPGYEEMHPGMTREATLWILNQGVKVTGTDAWGWDRPIEIMALELKAGKKDTFWEAHFLGKEKEYCHLERMANLDKIPKPFGFKVAAFPIKIENASAGWVRAVAILED
jgi:kynurenine formamidase